ncbi:hypothetical protein HAX54_035629 [Datura stramonium]|uniref:Uncharacterized protein n=1 Tax=Datura stramonium TaxID=4076 RepID=A0ABS8VIP0_DATST|nr:hypothetical protein [Datura stramonium]
MGAIITKEINWRAVKLSTSLPFQCLITRLCREAHVPILVEIDVKAYSTKKYDLKKSKDEKRSGGPSAKVAKETRDPAEPAKGTKSVSHVAQHPTLTPSTSRAAVAQQGAESAETSSILGTFVDRAIKAILELYKNLHAHVDDMEAWVNDRLKELTMPDLARFVAELKKAPDDILKLQKDRYTQEFSIPEFRKSKEDVPLLICW